MRKKIVKPMGRINSKCDLISNLPDNVIENILVHLTLKEAIKMSTLSKRWRYKWITIPQVVFDSSTFGSDKRSQLTHKELLLTIHQVLLLHEGAISKFMLSIPRLGSCPEIDHLISFLSRKGIQEITLCILEGKPHKMPLYLFSCLQMSLLCLERCVFKPPPDFAGFAKLMVLNFSAVDLPAKFAETFVARCPLLECLTLHYCTNLDCISFNAHNLKLLDYTGAIGSLSFKNTPGLKKVSLKLPLFGGLPRKTLNNTWMEAFSSLLSLEYLQIGSLFILCLGIVPERLASNMDCLSVLLLLGIDFCKARHAGFVLCLIKSSPNLRKLKIQVQVGVLSSARYFPEVDPVTAKKFSEAKDSLEFSLQKLQAVEISFFQGLISEMEFIGLLLVKSPVLETLHIHHCNGRTTDQKFMAERKMNQFRRASPRAEVIFRESNEG